MATIKQSIRYEADRDPGFPARVMAKPGGEKLMQCIQCGTCSGVCPLSNYMDHTPRQIIYLAREGFRDDVLASRTVWLCSSCYACTVECPRQIKITDIMYAVKRLAIEEGRYPRHFPIPVLAREFFNMVRAKGRTNETRLALRLFLKTSPLQLLGTWKLGLNLMRTGRFTMFKDETIKQQAQLASILEDNQSDREAV
jgi:heterodisulfide reductase subunit C